MHPSTGQTSAQRLQPTHSASLTDELSLAVELREDRLVRSVLADDVAAAAFDAEVLMDLGLRHVVEIEMLPVGDRGDRAAAEILDRRVALAVHVGGEA